MAGPGAVTSRVTAFSHFGKKLEELNTSVTRSWLLNDAGGADFSMGTTDPKCTPANLNIGNWILVEHEKLPPYAGMIYLPRGPWTKSKVAIKLVGIGGVLNFRRGDQATKIKGTPGAIFLKLLETANKQGDTLIRPGDVWTGGTSREETITPTQILGDLKRIAKRSGCEFEFVPVVSGGMLSFVAHLKKHIGSVIEDIGLEEGFNVEEGSSSLTEQGTLANDLLGYGDGLTWTDKGTDIEIDVESRKQYGLFQGSYQFSGVTSPATLKSNTRNQLQLMKQPRLTYPLSVLDVGKTWNTLQLGNEHKLRLHSVGFFPAVNGFGVITTVRTYGMAYSDDQEKVSLVTDQSGDAIYGDY